MFKGTNTLEIWLKQFNKPDDKRHKSNYGIKAQPNRSKKVVLETMIKCVIIYKMAVLLRFEPKYRGYLCIAETKETCKT